MKQDKKVLLIKYITCFGIASLIAFLVFLIQGFFTDRVEVNIQLLADGFFVPGILFTLLSGMLYVINEGIFIGIGYIFRNIILTFLPMGRAKQELYADYRERKMSEKKISNDSCILVTGLVFLALSIIFTVLYEFSF